MPCINSVRQLLSRPSGASSHPESPGRDPTHSEATHRASPPPFSTSSNLPIAPFRFACSATPTLHMPFLSMTVTAATSTAAPGPPIAAGTHLTHKWTRVPLAAHGSRLRATVQARRRQDFGNGLTARRSYRAASSHRGAGRDPVSAPGPSTEWYTQLNEPSACNISSSQPCVLENRFTINGGSDVNSRSGTPPVETWNAVIPSTTHESRLSTGQDRS